MMFDCEDKPLVCDVITIGKNGVHNPWRVCSRCGGEIEDAPDKCPHCNAKVYGFVDKYIRCEKIVLD